MKLTLCDNVTGDIAYINIDEILHLEKYNFGFVIHTVNAQYDITIKERRGFEINKDVEIFFKIFTEYLPNIENEEARIRIHNISTATNKSISFRRSK